MLMANNKKLSTGETALDCGYLPAKQATELTKKCEEIGRLLGGMMAKADLFCREPGQVLRESVMEYLVSRGQ
jgi:hypothetical protein